MSVQSISSVNRMFRWLAGLALIGVLGACSKGPAADIERHPTLQLDRAWFVLDDSALPPPDDAAWKAQALPDNWQLTRPGVSGYGWYRLNVELPAIARHDYGIYLKAALSNTQLFVNGKFAGQLGDMGGLSPEDWEAVHLFVIPRQLLHAGMNRFDLRIHVPVDEQGGIGALLLGLEENLRLRWLRGQFGHVTGPAVASLTILVLGCFILILWLRKAGDRTYFIFACATILWGLHTASDLLPRQPLPSPHFEIWWNALYVFWVVLLCIFSLRYAATRWPRYERVAMAYAGLAPLLLYAAANFGVHHPAARWLRLGVIFLVLVALWAVFRHALRTRDLRSGMLLLAATVAAIAGMRDWLAAIDSSQPRPIYLVPYVGLFFLAFVGWVMIDRFVTTLRQYERLNIDLEKRVAEKSLALESELSRQAVARRDAEAANLAKSRFLAAASHDLRQPLHALGIFAAALEQKTGDAQSRTLVSQMNQSIASLESLFNEVLDISRLDAGVMKANIRPVSVQALFDRLAVEMMPEAERKQLALRFVPTPRWVQSDPVLLERVLRNLVNNAIRYTESGAILVGLRRCGEGLALDVRDSGIGIGAEHQARVFEEFYRVAGPGTAVAAPHTGEGIGLGLSIVARLCELLGHRIELFSAPQRGSCFRLHLLNAQAPGEPGQPELGVGAGVAAFAGRTVVLIDDDPNVRDSMKALLSEWNMAPVVAASAAEALRQRAAMASPPALLIVDYWLGSAGDGIDAALKLRAAWSATLPVLIISGESSPAELGRIRASGFTLLHKPVAPAKLRSMIAHLLQPSFVAGGPAA